MEIGGFENKYKWEKPKLYNPEIKVNLKDNRWFYGETGTYKTSTARIRWGDNYYKKNFNDQFWDLYKGEETVVIEDMPFSVPKKRQEWIKIWMDHDPFIAPEKGTKTKMVIRPKRFIVTSQMKPNEAKPIEFLNEQLFGDDAADADGGISVKRGHNV